MTSTTDKLLVPIFIVSIIILGSVWATKAIYDMRHPELNKKEITFNVVGIVNATNSSIVSIQFECIKYCIYELKNDGYNYLEDCYKQCANLGLC